ncbi:thioredoxin domain-containing protein [bacterium]|jgi:protein-disulfide isomerase|nr:thioredoxin domain-containing protein [bacterium]MBT4251138.1 thioredoxin domain-containing protein [bacterium]MBT4598070.1 thioredoxin domain-containing protein [bacterium]MBT6753413.1 thioredoxin domain-containing protein [bacterium]MBT7038126.1 thioredoxin domain-containing protein [bacterium]
MSKKKKKNGGHAKKEIIESNVKKEAMKKEDSLKTEMKKREEEIKVNAVSKEEVKSEEEIVGQTTLSELDEKTENQKTIKNLVSAVILLSGIAVGSFFVDIVQFMSGDGFSKRALDNSEVLVAGDRTWVAFNEPAIDVKVLTVSEEEMKNCKNCDTKEVLLWLRDYIPTMVVNNVDAESEEGKAMIEAYEIKSLPAFFFSEEIEQTKFFQGEGRVVFAEKNDSFMLNAAGLGIPVGKYLQTPEVGETDAILGNKEAKVKVVVFSDFQCPYCGEHFKNAKEAVKGFSEEEVALVYKDLPLNFHLQGKNAAMAARCSQDQEKFWEMGELLYSSQKDWQDTEGIAQFKKYARELKLDTFKFNKCMDDRSAEALVDEDLAQAKEIGVTGTPATFVGTQFASGVVTALEIKAMIQNELDGDIDEMDADILEDVSSEMEEETEEEVKVQ